MAPLLSRELILARAVHTLREPHAAPLTWRGLAEDLKVKPSALYHYFPNKQALERTAYAQVLAQLPLPRPGEKPWQGQLSTLARDFRTLYQSYPGIAAHVLKPKQPLAEEHAVIEVLAGLLKEAGVRDADLSTVTLNLIVFFASSFVVELDGMGDAQRERRHRFTLHHAQAFPLLASLPAPAATASEQNFELIARLLIAGVQGLADVTSDALSTSVVAT